MPNIGLTETLEIEFKSDQDQLPDHELIECVVAFSNAEGGDIYVGIEDDGEITGLHIKHSNVAGLPAVIANNTVPPVSVRVEKDHIDGASYFIMHVNKMKSPVATTSGKILRRRLKADGTPENIPMYPYEIVSRLSDLSLLDFSAQPVPDSEYSDLDPVERARLRRIIQIYSTEKELLDLSDEELDKALQLITTVEKRTVPTMTGMLLIGKKDRLSAMIPTAETAIQVLSGTDVKVNESFIMPLLAGFEKITEYMNAWNREEEFEDGLFRISIPEIDRRAFREALVNAFSHRDYSILGRVRVAIEEEGLTISNPGGFIEGVTISNLIWAEPHGRNPVLSDAMKRIGLAERTGRGIDRIFEGSLLYGKQLPDYSKSTEKRVELYIPKSIPDKSFIRMITEEQRRLGRSLPILTLLILNSLKRMRRATVQEIVSDTNANETKVRDAMEHLSEAGLVEALGSGKGRYYILSAKVYRASNDSVGYVRQSGIDALRYKELVMKLAVEQGEISRANVIDLLHVAPSQAFRILKRLADAEELELISKGRGAKYIPTNTRVRKIVR
ncbi:MAG: putative DNA binding domain-containing protein [Clostridiales bacterium]|nr:putative DNA binding domain-containing protein [Clostridiales bacterium]